MKIKHRALVHERELLYHRAIPTFPDFYKKFICILFVECFACMNVSVPYVCSACEGQDRALDPLDLKLQKTVTQHVGAGN